MGKFLYDLTEYTGSLPSSGYFLVSIGTGTYKVKESVVNSGSSGSVVSLNDLSDVDVSSPTSGYVLKYNGSSWVPLPDLSATGSAISHSTLSDLTSDDHPQYFTTGRADSRYATITSLTTGLSGCTATCNSGLSGKVGTGIIVTGNGLASGGGALTTNRTIVVSGASSGEAISGTSNTVVMTPARTAQAISGFTSGIINMFGPYVAVLDSVNGNDSTAQIGNINKSFFSLQGVIDAVSSGSYSEISLVIKNEGSYSATKAFNQANLEIDVYNFSNNTTSISLIFSNLSNFKILNRVSSSDDIDYSITLNGKDGTNSHYAGYPITFIASDISLEALNINGGNGYSSPPPKAANEQNGTDGADAGDISINLLNVNFDGFLYIYPGIGQTGGEGGDSVDIGGDGGSGGDGSHISLTVNGGKFFSGTTHLYEAASAAAGGSGGFGPGSSGNTGVDGSLGGINTVEIVNVHSASVLDGFNFSSPLPVQSSVTFWNSFLNDITADSSSVIKCCFYQTLTGPSAGIGCTQWS